MRERVGVFSALAPFHAAASLYHHRLHTTSTCSSSLCEMDSPVREITGVGGEGQVEGDASEARTNGKTDGADRGATLGHDASCVETEAGAKVTETKDAKRSEEENGGIQTENRAATAKGTEKASQPNSHPWQAVWDATRNAWYFWNSVTQETTWENPLAGKGADKGGKPAEDPASRLEGDAGEGKTAAQVVSNMTDEEVALACGIDPDLAYLDPGMYATEIQQARMGMGTGASSSSAGGAGYRLAGAFDSRTGEFVPLQKVGQGAEHDPSRLGHAFQADRQMSAFFDVQQYHEERKREHEAQQGAQTTDDDGRIKRHRPTKKELKQFKERAKEKKAAKHAWLRS